MAGLFGRLAEQQRRKRREGRRFQHQGVAGQQDGRDLRKVQQEREIIARDPRDDSHRFAHDGCAAKDLRPLRVHRIGRRLDRQLHGVVAHGMGHGGAEMVERRLHLHGPGDALRASHLGDDQRRDPGLASVERGMEARHDRDAFGHRHHRPGATVEGPSRRSH
ncbi:MAG TPA: hypothetical protein PLH31_06530, partial [Caulobacter sp.]|nr:hypothetical protein [Caulobacter sp.]